MLGEQPDRQPSPSEAWWRSLRLRDVASATVVVVLVLVAFALAIALRGVIIGAFLGILLATALRPLMDLMRGRLPRVTAATIAVGVLVGAVLAFGTLLAPMLVEQVRTLAASLPEQYRGLRETMLASPLRLVRQVGSQLAPAVPAAQPDASPELASELVAWLPGLGRAALVTVATLLFTYYWLLLRDRMQAELLLFMPSERREGTSSIWGQIEDRIGAFVRGQLILSLATGLLSLVGYWLVGTPYVALMAIVAALFELVPFIGPFLSMGVATAAGLSISPTVGLLTLGVGIAIQQIENLLLVPNIMERQVGISPIVTMLSFVGFAALFGPIGGFLSIPLAATLQVLFEARMARRQAEPPAAEGRDRVARLRYQLDELQRDLATHLRDKPEDVVQSDDQVEEELEAVVVGLRSLLDPQEAR